MACVAVTRSNKVNPALTIELCILILVLRVYQQVLVQFLNEAETEKVIDVDTILISLV